MWAGRPYVLNPNVVVEFRGDFAEMHLPRFGHSVSARGDLAAWLATFDRAFDVDILQLFEEEVVEYLAETFIIVPRADAQALGGGLTRPARRPVGPSVESRDLRHLRPHGVCVFGVPLDTARVPPYSPFHGPACIRHAVAEDPRPNPTGPWVDLGDVVNWPQDGLPDVGARIRHLTRRVLASGCTPMVLGGDHATTYFVLEAVSERHRHYSVVQFDAHRDLVSGPTDEAWRAPLNHASVMSHALRLPGLSALVQLGVRPAELGAPSSVHPPPNVLTLTPEDLRAIPLKAVLGLIPAGPVYLSIDLDVLDPASAPEVTTPSAGGLSAGEVLRLAEAIASSTDLIGVDLVEVCAVAAEENRAARCAAALAQMIPPVLRRMQAPAQSDVAG